MVLIGSQLSERVMGLDNKWSDGTSKISSASLHVEGLQGTMGASATGKIGETFPTRILNLEIYWGIFPVKTGETWEFPQ